MAFSIFRNSLVRLCTNRSLLGNVKSSAKMDSARNFLIERCGCASVLANSSLNGLSIREYSKNVKHQAGRQYLSASESDSDLEWIGHRGESDFWRRKIRTFHSILDLNKDGVVSFDDFKLLADNFVNLGHLSEKHTKEFYSLLKDLWVKQWGEISQYNLVTVEKYLESMHHVLNDKRLVRRAHSFLPYLFKAVDNDHDGQISLEEFKLFFSCLGLKELDAILAFRAIDSNGDGKISQREFVKHGRDFFLTEDEDRISKYFWGPLVDH